MQIHEITHKRVDEAMLGVAGAIGRQISGALQRKAFGSVISPTGGATMDRAQALKLGQQLATTLTPVMMKQWGAAVQAAMAQSKNPTTGAPVTSVAELTPDSRNTLKAELDAMISQAIQPRGAFDYNNLKDFAAKDTLSQNQAQAVTDKISQAADQIFKATVDPAAGINTAQAWKSLVQDGIAASQGIIAFEGGGSSGGAASKTRFDTDDMGRMIISINGGPFQIYDNSNPLHNAAAKASGIPVS